MSDFIIRKASIDPIKFRILPGRRKPGGGSYRCDALQSISDLVLTSTCCYYSTAIYPINKQ